MLASISLANGTVTVVGSPSDDIIVVSASNGETTDITINPGQPEKVFQRVLDSQINEIRVFAGDGNDSVFSSSFFPMRVSGQNGDDVLNGGFGNDVINGNDGDDRIVGKAGDDTLYGSVGVDEIFGGNGNDVIRGGDGADRLFGHDGDDRIFGESGVDFIGGGGGDDTIYGGQDLDNLYGNDGADEIYGELGNDRIYGGNGDDLLLGDIGNDRLVGGPGDDYLNGGAQADTVFGNLGSDTFVFDSLDNVKDLVSPADRYEFDTDGNSVFSHVYDDGTIDVYGTHGSDEVRIREGSISVNSEVFQFDVAQAPVVRVFALNGADDVRQLGVIVGGPSYHLYGGGGNDYLRGGFKSDILVGGAGNDRLVGINGADTYQFSGDTNTDLGFDVLLQNSGVATLDFSGLQWNTGVDVNLSDQVTQTVANVGSSDQMLELLLSGAKFTNVVGTKFDDTFTGFIRSAEGLRGNDIYRPTNIPLSIVEFEGDGFDVVDHSLKPSGTIIDMTAYPNASIEHVIGTDFADTLINNSFTQVLAGGQGDDDYQFSPTIESPEDIDVIESVGNGTDTLDYSNFNSSVAVDLRDFPEVENLIGTDFEDLLIGNAKDNQIFGGHGSDYIEGREGVDDLRGQGGTDIYNVIPGEELEVTDVITDTGTSVVLPEVDNDGDGLLPSEEQEAGTDSNEFDSDGDLLGDGFEEGSDSLDPLSHNDPHGDSDGDGLSELDEQIYETDPDNSDTDGDGTSDFDEIEQGGDPTDSSDEGEAPADEDIVKLDLTIGDHSGSHSERYDLSVGRIHHQAPEFGVVVTDDYSFERGKVLDIRIAHRGSKLNSPDYDYQADIQLSDDAEGLAILEDPEDIIRTDATSHFFFAQGKTAKLYLPKVDLDLLYPDGSEVAEEDETDAVKTGFIFPALDPSSDTELTELKLAKVAAGLAGATRLFFDSNRVRVWKNRQRTEEVINNSTEFEFDQEHSLFVESIASAEGFNEAGTDVGYANLQIRAVFTPKDLPENTRIIGVNAEDRVLLRATRADLDIGLHDEPFLSETAEDNPGITIDLGADKDELAKLNITSLIPDSLNYVADFFTLDFDNTILKIWNQTTPELTGLDSLEEVTSETRFDESQKVFSVWVEAFKMAETSISLVWHETANEGAATLVFDSVKVVTEGFRDVDILLAIGGTGSKAWLDQNDSNFFPGGDGKTVGGRWLSHLRNWTNSGDYGDGPEDEGNAEFFPGPVDGPHGSDSGQIIENAFDWVSERYWDAVRKGAEPKIDILGMSRGGFIASEVAWKIQREGFFNSQPALPGATSEHGLDIRYLGLYDPIDQTPSVHVTRSIPAIVEFSAVGFATNFAGSEDDEVSRYYWDRIEYENAIAVRPFVATHSAFQGAPTYSTDGSGFDSFLSIETGAPIKGHPSSWLDGYTDGRDVQGAIEVDQFFRRMARSMFVPIEFLDDEAYQFDTLHRDPNSYSPNHEEGYRN